MSQLLRTGDLVRVRSAEQILATLDTQGRFDGLPFMPEMLEFCGREYSVYRRADKVCDTINASGGLRRMRDTVHLAGVRCAGSSHGGCQASCLLHWKEAWLEPIGLATRRRGGRTISRPGAVVPSATVETLQSATTKPLGEDGVTRYSCQATEIVDASEPMSNFNVTQYVRDVRSGNATIREVISTVVSGFVNRYQKWSKKALPKWMLIREGRTLYYLGGQLSKTPNGQLHLQPGERVRVKSREEIAATLDKQQRNRGLHFVGPMIDDCGSEAQVRGRVSRMIDERSGRMRELTNDCVILEGKVCHQRLCPRGSYTFWREVWLTRVSDGGGKRESRLPRPGGPS